jgi:hypothetical protein
MHYLQHFGAGANWVTMYPGNNNSLKIDVCPGQRWLCAKLPDIIIFVGKNMALHSLRFVLPDGGVSTQARQLAGCSKQARAEGSTAFRARVMRTSRPWLRKKCQ